MNAMTWWDHETLSIWSQPWGATIWGPLQGTTLDMIPVSLAPWGSWRDEHPDTLVLDTDKLGVPFNQVQGPSDRFVIGAVLGDSIKAYRFTDAVAEGIINDSLGPFHVVVYAESETRNVHVYVRATGDQMLTFTLRDGSLVDEETGTVWDPGRGVTIDGPLKGMILQQVPYSSAFDWAWVDFYPDSEWYGEPPEDLPRLFLF